MGATSQRPDYIGERGSEAGGEEDFSAVHLLGMKNLTLKILIAQHEEGLNVVGNGRMLRSRVRGRDREYAPKEFRPHTNVSGVVIDQAEPSRRELDEMRYEGQIQFITRDEEGLQRPMSLATRCWQEVVAPFLVCFILVEKMHIRNR